MDELAGLNSPSAVALPSRAPAPVVITPEPDRAVWDGEDLDADVPTLVDGDPFV